LACRCDRTRWLASAWMPASAAPSISRYVAAAGTGARRIGRSPAVLSQSFAPAGPYPLLAISGEQGSATVLSKILGALIDPNVAPVRALPREERELMIAANNGHLLAFDNLSCLSPRLSDALCRLASGGSFAVRQLYTNDEEVLFKAARPTL